jgi:hypothetical protein
MLLRFCKPSSPSNPNPISISQGCVTGVGKGKLKNRQADKRVLDGTYNIICAVRGRGKPGFFNATTRRKNSSHRCINNEVKTFSPTTTFAIKEVERREFKSTEIVII